MEVQVSEIEFSKLRHAYVVVKHFLENASGQEVKNLDAQVENDLDLFGDENLFLLEEFVTRFELDYANFDYRKHFYSEGEVIGGDVLLGALVVNLLAISVWLPLKTIELLTLNKIDLEKPKIPVQRELRKVSDLTFKEMIVWYIEKNYQSKDSIIYKIKASC
jgi:hypothetical protein